MKTGGLVLLSLGFIAGALAASQTPDNVVAWTYFVPAALVAVAGVVLMRLADRRDTADGGTIGGGIALLHESIDRVVSHIQTLDAEAASLNPYDAHGRIDETFVDDLETFADHRKRIAAKYGLQAYAEVMNEFAAGERYLNRVWSASVDGYVDEVRTYIGRARAQFELTQSILRKLKAR